MNNNQKQNILIQNIKNHCNFWEESNDIYCQSHTANVIDMVISLQDDKGFTGKEAERFGNLVNNLIYFIRTIK